MPTGPQRSQPTLVYLPQSSPGQRQSLSMYGKQNPGWMQRPADWGGAEDSGAFEGQASWTNVNAPRLPERRKLQRDEEGRIMWDPVSTGLARAAGKTARGAGRAAKRVSQWGGPPMIGRGAPAPGWRVGQGQPRRAAPAPAGPQGPTIAGALPPAGGSSPWAGGGRSMPQAGAPVGTYASGRGPVDPNQPALTVGGGPDYEGERPAIRMRKTNPPNIVTRRSGGGQGSRYSQSPGGTSPPTAVEAKMDAIDATSSPAPGGRQGRTGMDPDRLRRVSANLGDAVKKSSGNHVRDTLPGMEEDDGGGGFWAEGPRSG